MTSPAPLRGPLHVAHAAPAPGPLAWWEAHPAMRFWVAQLAIWTAYSTWTLIGIWGKLPPGQRWAGIALNESVIVTGTLAAAAMRGVIDALDRARSRAWLRVALVVAAAFAVTWLWRRVDYYVVMRALDLTPLRGDWPLVMRASRGDYATALLAWAAGYAALDAWRRLQERQRDLLEARMLATDAQLRALAYQLNPHFLFNALNGVRAMIAEDPARAREMVTQLAGFLRHALARAPDGECTVAEELRSLESYLAIELARFEERLDVSWDVEPGAAAVRIPTLLLQPLVENAVRHGDPDEDGRLRIAVRARRDGPAVRLEVANTGRLPPGAAAVEGVGLSNVRRRLAHAYPGRHRFALEHEDGWVRARVDLLDEAR
ncbi:MAG TPA: histidine kinase [Gemmatimonadaceae bacterium]|nr:histidine kinase [Gemmatimonadaceae bacterium]